MADGSARFLVFDDTKGKMVSMVGRKSVYTKSTKAFLNFELSVQPKTPHSNLSRDGANILDLYEINVFMRIELRI